MKTLVWGVVCALMATSLVACDNELTPDMALENEVAQDGQALFTNQLSRYIIPYIQSNTANATMNTTNIRVTVRSDSPYFEASTSLCDGGYGDANSFFRVYQNISKTPGVYTWQEGGATVWNSPRSFVSGSGGGATKDFLVVVGCTANTSCQGRLALNFGGPGGGQSIYSGSTHCDLVYPPL